MVEVVWFRFQQCLIRLTMLLVEGSSETRTFRDLFNHVFRSPQYGKWISCEGHLFFWKCSKFKLHFKNSATNSENSFSLRHNIIWIGYLKLSLLRTEYLSAAVNMLTDILSALYITKQSQLPSKWSKNMIKVLWFRFQKCLVSLTCCFPKCPLKRDFLQI